MDFQYKVVNVGTAQVSTPAVIDGENVIVLANRAITEMVPIDGKGSTISLSLPLTEPRFAEEDIVTVSFAVTTPAPAIAPPIPAEEPVAQTT